MEAKIVFFGFFFFFEVVTSRKQSNCPKLGDWLGQPWCISEKKRYAASKTTPWKCLHDGMPHSGAPGPGLVRSLRGVCECVHWGTGLRRAGCSGVVGLAAASFFPLI